MASALFMALAPGCASAQEVSGPLIAPGRLRLEVNMLYLYADTRFGERSEGGTVIEEEEPLGFDFSDTAVSSRMFPGLEALEGNLATATGGSVEPLLLGSTRAVVTRDAVWVPIRIDIGIFDWLSVGGVVPFSRRRAEVAWAFDGNGANAGLTPVSSDPAAVGDFLDGLFTAEVGLMALADDLCSSSPTAPGCLEASSLLADGKGFQQAILGALGSQGVFPLDGTPTGDALQTRVQALMDAHQALGVSYPASVPLATQLLTEDDYARLVTDPAWGVVGAPFDSWRSAWEMGDVELYGNVRLWDSSAGRQEDEVPSTLAYQVGAGALVRLGTGKTDLAENFVDTGGGDGQQDVEVSVFGGVTVGRRLGLWGEVRYGLAASTAVLRRVAAPDRVFPLLSATEAVQWTPGNYFHLRLTPRFHLIDEMSFAVDFRAFSKGADTYESLVADGGVPSPLDAGLLELETRQTMLEAGVGVVYSTLRGGRGRPLEARFLVRRGVSGSGGLTPKAARIEFGLRLFKGLWN